MISPNTETVVEPVFIALGSNLGDSVRNIRDAVALLDGSEGFAVSAVAPLYESAPMYVEDQPRFVNTCLMGRTSLAPEELLGLLKKIEGEIGRQVTFRNGPRVIDLDIVYFGRETYQSALLTIPHPKRRERGFVLQPLRNLAPDFRDPETGETIQDLLAKLGEAPLGVVD